MAGRATQAPDSEFPGPLGERARLEMIDDEALLFHVADQKVYRIDRPSAFVWSALAASEGSLAFTIDALAEQGDMTQAAANDFVQSCLAQWRALGLFAPQMEPPEPTAPTPAPWTAPAGASAESYGVGGLSVRVSLPDSAARDAIDRLAGHLKAGVDVDPQVHFIVSRAACGYRLTSAEASERSLPDAEAVAINWKNDVLAAALRLNRHLIALHGAALLTPAGPILLAGVSGSGKTTLSALLNASGWPLVADDILLLDTRDGDVTGLPFAFAVKPESWSALSSAFARLKNVAPRTRPDGRVVRYLTPKSVATSPVRSVSHIIFPRFQIGEDTTWRPVTRSRALNNLLGEAQNHDRRLSAQGFSSVCQVVRKARTHELLFGDPIQAAGQIQRAHELGWDEEQASRPGKGA